MAYEGRTSSGSNVNANLYKVYQQHVIDLQSNGMAAPTYDEWYRAQAKQAQQQTQDDNSKYY